MAILLAIVIHPVGFALGEGVQQLYPFSDEMLEQMKMFGGMLEQMADSTGVWLVLVVMAVTPAICEELAFRGFILSGLRHMGHKWSVQAECVALWWAPVRACASIVRCSGHPIARHVRVSVQSRC